MSLTEADIAVVEEAREELRATPLPPAMGQLGCLGVIAGLILLVAWPRLLDALPAASFFTPFAMLFAMVGILGGPVVLMFGGQSGRSAARAAIEASLRVLEDLNATREEQLRAAVVLLGRAYVSQGPSTDRIIDLEEAGRRIGAQRDLVLAVEEFLVDTHGAWPVLGSGDSPAP